MNEKIRFLFFSFSPVLVLFLYSLLNYDEVECRHEMDKLQATLLARKIMLPEPLIAWKLNCHRERGMILS